MYADSEQRDHATECAIPPDIPVGMAGRRSRRADGSVSAMDRDHRDPSSGVQTGALPGDFFARTPPPSQRRVRSEGVATHVVRVELADTDPPVARHLELASDLMLDEVHDVIQIAFGWLDYHLHRFGSGPDYLSRETEYYLCPFEVDEGEVGIPDHDVRLDEVLASPGDRLWYCYDFGDDWLHVLTLEAILPRAEGAPRGLCTDGQRPAPAEDCGGAHGYELISAAVDRNHPNHAAAVAEHSRMYGAEVDPASHRPIPLDVMAINEEMLAELGHDLGTPATDLPEPLADLLADVRNALARRDLRRMINHALFNELPETDRAAAASMVRPYAWLLERVGADGIALTSAGYLPPVHVKAAWDALDLAKEWIGKGNREVDTVPLLRLRESAQRMGLLRKYRGRLLLTRTARKLLDDPVALWWHLAERMPLRSTSRAEDQAGMIALVLLGAGQVADMAGSLARFLGAIGWMNSDGTEMGARQAWHAAYDTRAVLRRLSAVADTSDMRLTVQVTDEGMNFAKAALRTWPN